MIINRQDFTHFIKVSNNMQASQLNPFFEMVENDSLLPLIGQELLQDILDINTTVKSYRVWETTTVFSLDQYGEYKGKVYRSLGNANVGNFPDAPSSTFWAYDELATFYYLYVRPFAAYQSGGTFLVFHGHNITQFGIVVPSEGTSLPASPLDRSNMIKFCEKSANTRKSNLITYGKAAKWTFNTKKYDVPIEESCSNSNQFNSKVWGI